MSADTLTITGINPLDADAYHADHHAWSRGMIASFRDRRSICYARYVLGTAPPEKATKPMELGDLAHAALLEPHRLATDYVAYPKSVLSKNGSLGTNAAEDFRKEQEAAGRLVLKEKDFATVAAMVESVRAKVGKWITPDAKIENAVYWTDEATGLPCRCRPDVLIVRDFALCLDIKTTGDVSPDKFRKRIEDGDLLLQDSHYSDGIRIVTGLDPRFLFVAVESSWPFCCAVYEIDQQQRARGWANRRTTMMQIADCINTGVWEDAWESEINRVQLRPWAL